jgi:hypothetical protein
MKALISSYYNIVSYRSMSSEIMNCEGWQVAKAKHQVILYHILGYTNKKFARPHGAWGNSKLLYMKQECHPLEEKVW